MPTRKQIAYWMRDPSAFDQENFDDLCRLALLGLAVRAAPLPSLNDKQASRELKGIAKFLENYADTEGACWVLESIAKELAR